LETRFPTKLSFNYVIYTTKNDRINEMNTNSEIKKLQKEEIPEQLLEIPQPPEQVFVRGNIPHSNTVMLCVVGSRKYSNYGRDVCEELIAGLAGYDVTIVSGLALGIDSIAHRSALNAGLKTIAIPGSGLKDDVLYPASNYNLAMEIIEKGGALLSEFEPDFKATPWSFPKRNRIMAGISKAVLIIEAGEKSGTLITARMATDYNKDVFVVPASIFSDGGKGSNKLMRLGATPISSSEELLDELGFTNNNTTVGGRTSHMLECSEDEKRVLEILEKENEISRDELMQELAMEVSKANILLSAMEIKGMINESMGVLRKC
jgi:DNA processing protein